MRAVAWRVIAKGGRFTRGIYENPTEQDFEIWRLDGDTAEPLYGAAALQSRDEGGLVCFYEHDFYVLSNFSSFRLQWMGQDFDTSEHAYHWEKFRGASTVHQNYIRHARSAHEAFKYAEKHKADRRQDWDAVKVDVMRAIIKAKAEQHEYVMRKLLATGNRLLVEDSWRDDFWGWGPNKDGKNMLGKLWMELRDTLPTPPRKP